MTTPLIPAETGGRPRFDLWLVTCSLLLIGAAGYGLYKFRLVTNPFTPKVVIFDAEKLFTAKAAQVAHSPVARPETIQTDAAAVIAGIKQELRQYQDRGFIVLNASQVMAWPAAQDITPDIARNLHIALPETP